ncbi:hypothetical protein JCM17960_21360 [Magnetospira thiophila]
MSYTDAIVVEWGSRAGTIDYLKDGLSWGLQRNGFRTHRISIVGNDAPALIDRVNRLWDALEKDGGRPFIVDTQARSPFKTRPRFSFILDHPLDHPNLRHVGTGTVLGLCDASYLRLNGYSDAQAIFFPHAGLPPDPDPLPIEQRPIDILFSGALAMAPHGATRAARLAQFAPPIRAVVEQACADIVDRVSDPYEALTAACLAQGIDPNHLQWQQVCRLVALLGNLAQGAWRWAMMEQLKSLPVTVVGPVASDFFQNGCGQVTLLGERPYEEVQDLMRRSKVVLNMTPKFKAGSHERICSAMAAGAVVCTNPSQYLPQDFTHGESIVFQASPAATAAQLADLLACPQNLQAMAEAAMPLYTAKHTFEARVRDFLTPLFG